MAYIFIIILYLVLNLNMLVIKFKLDAILDFLYHISNMQNV